MLSSSHTIPQKNIAIMGATGSIGDSTLSVVSQHPDLYNVVGVTGFSRLDKLLSICQQFEPTYVCVAKEKETTFAQMLSEAHLNCKILIGEQGLVELATLAEVDMVVAAIVGAAGLPSTLAAANAGKTILLANKEALVMAGELMIKAVKQSNAKLLPIDSEHNAIFQCLPTAVQQQRNAIHDDNHGIKKLWLTASGGPFLHKTLDDMKRASIAEAVKHPNWSMGQKISVDSATMMNKGLELIEASFLFDMPVSEIEVVIHPQSIVHSMVEYNDGSFLAQLGSPDMRTPIAHAMAYPNRISSGVERLDIFKLSNLNFVRPDLEKFKCLGLAYQAMQQGSYACIALNASNEIAVQAFLHGDICLTDIADINEKVLLQAEKQPIGSLQAILAVDKLSREQARQCIADLNA
ncbi:1-deoxy-D-xylulose-5-phosphate reductoisomerase [Moraxella osloensis]|nr:1-deoxy-D-xylulose-5-phosphate reductoisomerase [Moraxella osloensis]MBW4008473.1 1-deoxy-D-xylulose-5-phosphate reductoisomerase [Moraxella osloensis]